MKKIHEKLLAGYANFRNKYTGHENSLMEELHDSGQSPQVMVVACCDSRVDPALLLQCHPGDLFVLRNIANIIPPYDVEAHHQGAIAALEYGINFLKVKHLIILGHSECGGIKLWMENKKNNDDSKEDDNQFISNWLSIIDIPDHEKYTQDECAEQALKNSYANCLTFPWIKDKVENDQLMIHLWFFDIKSGIILTYNKKSEEFENL